MKRYLIPCFYVVDAETEEDALNIAADHRPTSNPAELPTVTLLFDEVLPVVPVPISPELELPHTMVGLLPQLS